MYTAVLRNASGHELMLFSEETLQLLRDKIALMMAPMIQAGDAITIVGPAS